MEFVSECLELINESEREEAKATERANKAAHDLKVAREKTAALRMTLDAYRERETRATAAGGDAEKATRRE